MRTQTRAREHPITVSAGVAIIALAPETSADALFATADAALYKAKDAARDRAERG